MNKMVLIILLLLSVLPSVHAKKLPSVKLKTVTGRTVDTAELENGGKPIIVCFFALWCKPCLRELTAIAEVYEKWQKETGVKLVAVSIDDSRSVDKVQAETNARGFEWEVLLDTNSDLKRAMNVNLIPYVVLLNGEGEICWQHSSYTDGGEEQMIEAVRKLTQHP